MPRPSRCCSTSARADCADEGPDARLQVALAQPRELSRRSNAHQRRQVELGEFDARRPRRGCSAPPARGSRRPTWRGRAHPRRPGNRPIARRCRAGPACGRGRTATRTSAVRRRCLGQLQWRMIDAAIVTAIRRRLTARAGGTARAAAPAADRTVDALGWLDRRRASRLRGFTDVFDVRDDGIALVVATRRRCRANDCDRPDRSHSGRRGRAHARGATSVYAVAPAIRRAAVVPARARSRALFRHAHLCGARQRRRRAAARSRMWLARRSPAKAIDPGMLDNLVGGGIAAGQSVAATVVKEAWEEAGIAATLAGARPTRGRRRHLPRAARRPAARDDFRPRSCRCRPSSAGRPGRRSGRASPRRTARCRAARSPMPRVLTSSPPTASLVVLDFLLRHGAIPRDAPD